ncbi:MAG: DUF4388 domain-containing protein [Acidobacteriota bacterium]|nr:DUF4388 domain-containing protein [Acidobacteriota bacterium]
MPLTGHLSDLSLSELIEFFCNQRKTGQLKVLYPQGRGYFYLQAGSVVDARIGALRGIDAVYYALTLPNANFEFGDSNEPIDRTINQPWAQVVLEGLRRLDEGVVPPSAFPAGCLNESKASEASPQVASSEEIERMPPPPAFLSANSPESTGKRKFLIAGATALAVIGSVAAIGVPAGWYGRTKTTAVVSQPESQSATTASNSANSSSTVEETPKNQLAEPSESTDPNDHSNDAALALKRQRDREKAKAREERASAPNQPAASLSSATSNGESAKSGPKKVSVTVTYDESGRVTQASGGDATAVRIARQKRFPAGKAGSATITIPMN